MTIEHPALLKTDKVQFVMLSFEGPDLFSMAGGLGRRAEELCGCLASMGYPVHLFFIGDPELPAVEEKGGIVLHRWCQWISRENPGGCYMAENQKVEDYAAYVPETLTRDIIAPAAGKGITTVVLAEEWQTIPAVVNLSRVLNDYGLHDHAVVLWNANNLYGLDRVNWDEVSRSCIITTVSRYMKHRMWAWGINPVVIHNGIPSRILQPVNAEKIQALRRVFPGLLLAKVGRYDVDKRWTMAMKAAGIMKRRGLKPSLVVRGGNEYHRGEVMSVAKAEELSWKEIHLPNLASFDDIIAELDRYKNYDVLELCFYVQEDFINVLYAASDCVLANSGHEPFGLVGLEVMACRGLAFVGATGEDYAQGMTNCVSVETEEPVEIAEYVEAVCGDKELSENLRREGLHTAAVYTWEHIIYDLSQKVRFIAAASGVSIDG